MSNPNSIFKKKNVIEDMEKNIINPETPPIKDPKNNLTLEVVLFNTMDIPNNSIKSNKKLIKKT